MKPIQSFLVFLIVPFLMVLSAIGMHGQSQNCLVGCTAIINEGGKTFSFKYKLIPGKGVNIAFRNGKYLINANSDNPTAKLEFSTIPKDLNLFFQKSRQNPNSVLEFKSPSCQGVFGEFIPIYILALKLNLKSGLSNNLVNYGASSNPVVRNCDKVLHKYKLAFNFQLEKPASKKEEQGKPNELAGQPSIAARKEPKTVSSPSQSSNLTPTANKAKEKPKVDEESSVRLGNSRKDIERLQDEEDRLAKEALEKEWSKTLDANSIEAYKAFIEAHPEEEEKIQIAKKEIARKEDILQEPPLKTDEGYEIRLRNVLNLGLDSTRYDSNAVLPLVGFKPNPMQFESVLQINTKRGENYILYLKDFDKGNPQKDTLTITLGNHLEPSITFNADSSVITFTFLKGKPPYHIYFFQKDRLIHKKDLKEEKSWTLEANYFAEKKVSGEVSFSITDALLPKPYINKYWKINIPEEPDNTLYWLIGAGGFILLLILIAQLRQARRGRLRSKYQDERTRKWEEHMAKLEDQKKNLDLRKQPLIEEGGNEFLGSHLEPKGEPVKSGIKIKKVKKAALQAAKYQDDKLLEKALKTDVALTFDMSIHWEDTMVQEILFTKSSTERLDNFLQEQNLQPLKEQEGQIPEIGGILLGKPFLSTQEQVYRVLIEEFVPIDPEYHDKYQLEFSAQSLANDLGDIQEEYPELLLVGWFHTHPGHGLFLSKPDLRIQDSFFKEPYQFAMEIDSLTNQLDTAFFTRMKNGKVNNRKDLREETPWFSWTKAEPDEN